MHQSALEAFRTRCEKVGFDVVWPFSVQWFNREVDAKFRLPDFERAHSLGIVIGNTRHLWDVFVDDLRRRAPTSWADNPLDAYVESTLGDAVRDCVEKRSILLFAHHVDGVPVAIQRIAQASGLAHLSPSHLSIHPSFGPWFALRAVIVVDADGPPGERLRAPDPCAGCAKPCVPALERALARGGAHDIAPHWEAWAEVRDVCPEGRSFRYDEEQRRYHYTKDPTILQKLVR